MTPGPEEWGAVAEPEGPQAWGAAPTAGPQSWGAVPAEDPKSWWERGQVKPTPLTMDPSVRTGPYVEGVMKAFGHGFAEGFGPDRLGISPETEKTLQSWGLFRSGEGDRFNPLKAMNEILTHAVIATPELALRFGGGLLRAGQAAAVEAGLPRDIAALPEAFFGMPHPLGIPQGFPAVRVRSEPARTTETPKTATETPSFTAEVGFDVYHGSPHDFPAVAEIRFKDGRPNQVVPLGQILDPSLIDAIRKGDATIKEHPYGKFDITKIGTGEGAQSFGHGLYFAENPAVSGVGGEYHTKFGEGAVSYQVRINANKEHFLDWDKPLSEQPTVSKILTDVVEKTGTIPDQYKETGNSLYLLLSARVGPESASTALREAGIPGIKYLDQGSRFQPPSRIVELAGGRFATESASGKLSQGGSFATRAEAQAHIDANSLSSNYVLFDDKLVEITHKNGEPLPDIAQARDLGVIGPERPSINEGAPKDAAEAVVKPPAEAPEVADGGWQARFDQFVAKLEAPKDVRRLIRNAATENENFPAARQGDIPLQHVEAVAEAAGVEPGEINVRGLGRTLRNDAEVRIAMRLMVQTTDNVKSLARDVVAEASEQNLIKFQEAVLRRDLAVEQIVGLRSEWGRTGNVFQEFMREVKDGEALDSFLKEKCPL